MRIKKTRILSMLMTMVLMCSTVLPIYAEDAAENVVYCYDDNFNSGTFKDGSKMSSAATYEFVEVASNKYVKMIDKSAASGHPQFSAQLDYTAVKSMFIELELSAPEAGLPLGAIRIAGEPKTNGSLQNNNLIFFEDYGVYLSSLDRTNKTNNIATISTDEFVKIGLLLNVDSAGFLNVDVYVYDDGVWEHKGQTEEAYKTYTAFQKIQLYVANYDSSNGKEVWFDDLKAYYVTSVTSVNSTPSSVQATVTETTEALGSTAGNVVVKLLDDIELGEDVTVNEGVTLDLNGYTLDMGDNYYLISFGDVVDSSADKTGRLKIATEIKEVVVDGKTESSVLPKGELAENNSQMPVYIAGEGYMLASMTAQALTPTIDTDYFTSVSRPSFGDPHYNKLQSGASAAKLQFILRLDWSADTDNDGTTEAYYQEFSYSDDLVQNVYTNGKAFSVTVNGLTNYASSMKVSEYVKSDLGVVLENNSFSMVETSGK